MTGIDTHLAIVRMNPIKVKAALVLPSVKGWNSACPANTKFRYFRSKKVNNFMAK